MPSRRICTTEPVIAIRSQPSILLIALGLGLFCGVIPSAADDYFVDVVAPILEQHCLDCHDDAQREGALSLQQAGEALYDEYIVRGDPEASRLIDVITPVGGHAEMPKEGEPLADDEREAVRRWIASGANWPRGHQLQPATVTDFQWWSFQPIERPVVPESAVAADALSIRTPIDSFVISKLHEQGLGPSMEADRRTLLRRLTYDLIGLPPTPEQIDRFKRDHQPQAYERVVDELLASKHYGERWARHWLDVVKYADTCGYDKDKMRPSAWPYRDYVIRSFNTDKPYERFVQEQVAGDILFPGEPDGVLGLGFIAAGPWDFIGHVEVAESKLDGQVARNLDRDDMVSGTLNTFCSLTVQCARCHHHKFDPITQQHYYGLQAIFAAVDRAERPYDLDPSTEQRRQTASNTLASLRAELKRIEQKVVDAGGRPLADIKRREAELRQSLEIQKDARFGYHSGIAKDSSSEKWVEIDLGDQHEVSRIVLHPCHDEFAGIGAGFGFPVRYRVSCTSDDGLWREVVDHTETDVPNPGLSDVVIDLEARPIRRIRVTATQLVARRDDFIFALAELEAIRADGTNVAIGAKVAALDAVEAPARWSRTNLTDGHWASYSDPQVAVELDETIQKKKRLLSELETPVYLSRRDQIHRSLRELESILASIPSGKMVYAAATHFEREGSFIPTQGKLRPIHVLHRGEVAERRELAIPGMLPLGTVAPWQLDAKAGEGERRAALARWLTDHEHPLVWRSIVNRIWQYHFGRGLVATPNDFGRMGTPPTHPALLDWLACEFRDGGEWMPRQSIKSLHRLIVTSSIYRQSSAHDDAKASIDGSNRYLWRMNRRRLEAEEIRDSILAVSGSLNQDMGGPGFQLFALERTEHSPHYQYHKFDPSSPETHRRSIYRFIVRSQPDPWMTTLDCADSSQSTPSRTETLTSLQALSLLNSRFNLVMAQRFASQLKSNSIDSRKQVARAFRLVTQRAPREEELAEMLNYAQQHGLNNLCRFLFNLSEFIYLD